MHRIAAVAALAAAFARRLFPVALTALLASCLLPAIVFAQAPDVVVVPWGDWVSQLLTALRPTIEYAFLGLLGWLALKLPPGIRNVWNMVVTEQVTSRAIGFGLNAVAGAAKGKQLEAQVGNAVVREALNYGLKFAPDLVAKIGKAGFAEKIIARLDLAPDAKVTVAEKGSVSIEPAAPAVTAGG